MRQRQNMEKNLFGPRALPSQNKTERYHRSGAEMPSSQRRLIVLWLTALDKGMLGRSVAPLC
jgi:hypothetical protein